MNWNKTLAAVALAALGTFASGPVTYYGQLEASGNQLVGSLTGSPVQVRGVSLGWSNTGWESADFFNAATVTAMVDDWKAEIIRVPVGSAGIGGYTNSASDAAANMARAKLAINAAIAKDVYVIIDWHSHQAESEKTDAAAFFSEMARTYGQNNHVIFEIYNEPLAISWSTIRSYSLDVVDTIRKYSDNLILVGTPNWSQDVNDVVNDPIGGTNSITGKARDNIAYVFHFYAATHTTTGLGYDNVSFQNKVQAALTANLPVFVSEWGTTHSDGGQPPTASNNYQNHYNTHDATSSNTWHTFLDSKKISSCAWNVNDKYEGSSFFGTSTTPAFDQSVVANWRNTSLMTASGAYVYNKLTGYASNAVWRNPPSSSSSAPSSSSNASSSSVGSSSSLTSIVIDDLEDGDGITNWLGGWFAYNDNDNNGGLSTYSIPTAVGGELLPSTDGAGKVMKMTFTLNSTTALGYNPFVAVGINMTDTEGETKDLSACQTISYRFKGNGHLLNIRQDNVTDNNYHTKLISASSSAWKTVTLSWSDFTQQPWNGSPVVAQDPTRIHSFAWQVQQAATTGSLMIDDVVCHTAAAQSSSSSVSSSSVSSSSVSSSSLSSSSVSSSSSSTPGSSSSVTSSSSAGTSSSSATIATVIDDFADQDNQANTGDYWYAYTDKDDKGASTITNAVNAQGDYTVVFQDGSTGNYAVAIKGFTLSQGLNTNDPYVAIGLDLAENGSAYDLANCTDGFSYRYKGAAHNFQAAMSSVKDYNYHFTAAVFSATWKTATVLFTQLEQNVWQNSPVVGFNASDIVKFAWQIKKTPTSGNLWVDDFKCLGSDLGLVISSSSSSPSSSSANTSSSSSAPNSSSSSSSSSSAKVSSSSSAKASSSSATNTSSSSSSVTGSSSSDSETPVLAQDPALHWNLRAARNSLTLSVGNVGMVTLEIFDLSGQPVKAARTYSTGNYLVPMSDLPRGVYWARARFGSKQQAIKIAIQ